MASIAYVDPGNVATNVTAGAKYGYLLVWVVVAANLMACQVQYLSAKLGLVTGLSLPQALRDRMSGAGRLAYWGQAELVAMATDLAEVLGGAIALNILFDLPLLLGGLITGVVSTVLLAVQNRRGQRSFERVITGLLAVITVGFFAGLFVVAALVAGHAVGGLVPGLRRRRQRVAGRRHARRDRHAARGLPALRPGPGPARPSRSGPGSGQAADGATRYRRRRGHAARRRGESGDAAARRDRTARNRHRRVPAGRARRRRATLGDTVALLFALALLASGLASTAVGCYAGAVVMDGLLRRRVPLLVRRRITLIPALLVLAAGVDPTVALVISQVVLSFGIPFALIPLVVLTAKRSVMGAAVNHRATTGIAGAGGVRRRGSQHHPALPHDRRQRMSPAARIDPGPGPIQSAAPARRYDHHQLRNSCRRFST